MEIPPGVDRPGGMCFDGKILEVDVRIAPAANGRLRVSGNFVSSSAAIAMNLLRRAFEEGGNREFIQKELGQTSRDGYQSSGCRAFIVLAAAPTDRGNKIRGFFLLMAALRAISGDLPDAPGHVKFRERALALRGRSWR